MKGIKTFFIILLLSVICTIFTKAECSSLNNPVAYYSFNTDCSTDIAHNYNLRNIGVAYNSTGGKLGGGCYFKSSENDYLINSSKMTTIADNAHTQCAWFKTTDYSLYGYITAFSTFDGGVSLAGMDYRQDVDDIRYGDSPGAYTYSTANIADYNYHFACVGFDVAGLVKLAYLDGNVYPNTSSAGSLSALTHFMIGAIWYGAVTEPFTGYIDEVSVYNYTFTKAQADLLYNSGSGCYPYTPASDTTPPTITFSSQRPSNLSTTNALSTGLNINYTVTDLTGVNISTVKMNFTVNNSNIWIDGNKYLMIYNNKLYTKNTGSMFNWRLDDNQIYNSIGLVNESLIESTVHNILILGNANNWLKITFRNVSKYKSYSFYEGMTENASSTLCSLQLYYCNSSYISGNPISNKNCALFYEGINTNVYNHSHSAYSKHKVYPMAISNGMVNDVGVTQTSNILYRGNNICNQNIYYVNLTHRTNDVQTTSNNGNVWSNYVGTIDGHLHQISTNKSESINYFIRACDTLGNCINSAKRSDIIELTNLNPSAPFIHNPIGTTYISNTPININYSACASPQLTPISRYKIDYAPYLSTTYTNIVSNNYPNLNYLWAINTISSGFYNIKVTCYDSTNKSAYSISETFSIVSFTDLLLTGINNSNSNIATYSSLINTNVSNIWSEIKMIGLILIFLVLLYLGLVKNITVFLFIDSFLLFYIGFNLYNSEIGLYKVFILILSITSFLFLLFYSSIKLFQKYAFKKEETKYNKYKDSFE